MEICNNSKVDLCFVFNDPSLRRELSRPYGILFTNNNLFINFLLNKAKNRIITVGDYVTDVLERNNIIPFIEIIDGKTKRTISYSFKRSDAKEYRVFNEAGKIRFSTIEIIKSILKNNERGIVIVNGEEDLLVIPVVLYSEIRDIIIYGQPNAGAVVIINNNLIKWRVYNILEKSQITYC
ncbi:MAG: DUF359 domain-containing protein [Saccharolobus sp.]|uniref:GTP-dependent dephospho-CoA kinase family protein n=1 Tax=Saccharolobus sp. TaxID=2100761 RepID=UPI0028CD6975|nr:DUF359 domain-containing protein [Saccharolobus sp.]MDT7860771.1 DUF359 domain-containing protein [Saccharolobus sp.]